MQVKKLKLMKSIYRIFKNLSLKFMSSKLGREQQFQDSIDSKVYDI